MKIFKIKSMVALAAAAITLASCQRKDDTKIQPDKVEISVASPAESQAFKKGETVEIAANASYISQMHGYQVKITNVASGAVLFNTSGHSHGDKISIKEQWVNDQPAPAEMKLEIIAIIDHEQNTSSKQVVIRSQP